MKSGTYTVLVNDTSVVTTSVIGDAVIVTIFVTAAANVVDMQASISRY